MREFLILTEPWSMYKMHFDGAITFNRSKEEMSVTSSLELAAAERVVTKAFCKNRSIDYDAILDRDTYRYKIFINAFI